MCTVFSCCVQCCSFCLVDVFVFVVCACSVLCCFRYVFALLSSLFVVLGCCFGCRCYVCLFVVELSAPHVVIFVSVSLCVACLLSVLLLVHAF